MGRHLARLVTLVVASCALLLPAHAGESGKPVRIPLELTPMTTSETVVVEKGDHLWKISARHLENRHGQRPAKSEVSPYWRDVIEENRGTIRSGDPDLIYPGEVVTLPPVTVSELP